MSDTKNTENESGGLKKSLRLIYVYAIAAGAIFTFIGYWDTIFYEYCVFSLVYIAFLINFARK